MMATLNFVACQSILLTEQGGLRAKRTQHLTCTPLSPASFLRTAPALRSLGLL